MKRISFRILTALLCLLPSVLAAKQDCVRFMPVGICNWLVCVGPVCTKTTSVKYGHFNPDVIVSVNNPEGVNRVEGGKKPHTQKTNHQNLIYRETDAIGNPLTGKIYCGSQAKEFEPYFISLLDQAGWRWGWPDNLLPPSWIPGLREIGNWPLNTWGNVMPRTGWTIQAEDPKAAAIVAQRTGDILTRVGEPRVYVPLTGPAKTGGENKLTFPPAFPLIENNNIGGDWQLLDPKSDDIGICQVFGAADPFGIGWSSGKVSADGNYLMMLWRPYTCCEIKGIFIGSIDFAPYPPPNDDEVDK